jgi:hypothetical protein
VKLDVVVVVVIQSISIHRLCVCVWERRVIPLESCAAGSTLVHLCTNVGGKKKRIFVVVVVVLSSQPVGWPVNFFFICACDFLIRIGISSAG